MKRPAMLLLALLPILTSAAAFSQAPPATVGWRQNWTGWFPEANPPTVWGRTLEDSVVKGLSVQAKKPAGDATVADEPMKDGRLHRCLVLGPFTPKDPAKALDEAFLADEANLRPDVAEKVGELPWTFLKQDPPSHCLHEVEPLPIHRVLGKPKPGQVAYAHAYLHSARAGKVALMLDHTGGCKLWVNGKVVLSNPNVSIGFGWWGPMSRGLLWYQPASRSQRVEVELKQGWNDLVFKVSASGTEWGRGWAFIARFIDLPPVKYTDKNIVWVADLPDRSNANPIVVGDKVFVVSEHDELICLDKKTGRRLWHAFNNYFEATPKAERDANPGFAEIAPLEEQALKETDLDKRRALLGQVKGLMQKLDPAKFGMNMESHPEGHWFSTGFTTPTPMSDGKYVYVWMTNGVAACYDLDGKRQWITRVDTLLRDPKATYGPFYYPAGAALAGGRLIFWDGETFALDANTGAIVWRSPKLSLGLGPQPLPAGLSAVALAKGEALAKEGVTMGGADVVVAAPAIFRAADGKVLWENKDVKYLSSGGGTFVDGMLSLPIACGSIGFHIYDFTDAKGETLEPVKRAGDASAPEQTKSVGTDYDPKGTWLDIFFFSAPVYHDGLMYMVDYKAMLYVVDAKAGKLVYRQRLPLSPSVNVREVALTAPLVLAGKFIYAFDNQGNCVVFEPGREYKQVALNHLETFIDRPHTGEGWQERGPYGAPVVDGNRLYVRSEAHLYCIGEK